MIELDLSKEEQEILVETLKSALSNLSYQIADTDNFDFRQGLRAKADALKKVVAELEAER